MLPFLLWLLFCELEIQKVFIGIELGLREPAEQELSSSVL